MINKEFILAGKAIFTVGNDKGDHYTFKVTKKEPKPGSYYNTPSFFVNLLTGPDNQSDYTYMGILKPDLFTCMPTKASQFTLASQPMRVFNWALRLVATDSPAPKGYFMEHEGRCGRCARVLTVPESISSGFGPECSGRI